MFKLFSLILFSFSLTYSIKLSANNPIFEYTNKLINKCLFEYVEDKSYIILSVDTNQTVLIIDGNSFYTLYLIENEDIKTCSMRMRTKKVTKDNTYYSVLFNLNNYNQSESDFNVDGFGRMVYFKFVDSLGKTISEWNAPFMSNKYPFVKDVKSTLELLYKTEWNWQ